MRSKEILCAFGVVVFNIISLGVVGQGIATTTLGQDHSQEIRDGHMPDAATDSEANGLAFFKHNNSNSSEETTQASQGSATKKPRYQKTKGVFVNATLYGTPIGLDVGIRLSPHFNLGGQLAYLFNSDRRTGIQSFGDFVGVAAYGKYFLSRDQSKSKGYLEAFFGVAFASFKVEEENKVKPYGSLCVGWQLASRKKVRFYFEVGVQALYNSRQTILRNPTVTVINDKYWSMTPQFTLIGLEF